MRKQIVRIVSIDKRYRKESYPFVPIYNHSIGTYITGQHVDPNLPETKGRLTTEEMEHPERMTAERKKMYPYIIQPEVRVPLTHLRSFNIATDEVGHPVNPKDHAEYIFFSLQTEQVAKSKSAVVAGQHYFYIENLESEATERLEKGKMRFEAEKLVREKGTLQRFKDIALLLNYKIKDFRINVNVSETILQDKIIEACNSNPADVLRCFSPESEKDLFILRAESLGLITRRGDSFFDGAQYLGDNLEDIKKFLKTEDGGRYERRWAAQSAASLNEPKSVAKENNDKERLEVLIGKCAQYIITGRLDDARNFYQEAFIIDPENEVLKKLYAQLNETKIEDKKIEGEGKEDESFEEKKKALEEKYAGKDRKSLNMSAAHLNFEVDIKDLSDEELRTLIINSKLAI